ncbi:MAG: DMT family transporter [Betaproteobacteria bacterium]|jgi:drug/metabolite transporter (DMT)-like permease|nr:DMT family transporter [Betaproteobacteria bacterium]
MPEALHPALPYAVLTAGVLVVSSASILIRFAQGLGVPSLSLAAWRLTLAALILTPFVLARSREEILNLAPRDVGLAALAGAFLAIHFATWIASLAYTSVAASTVLVTTNPIWIAAASWLLFRERPGAGLAVGIALALAGSLAIFAAGETSPAGKDPALGNALALIGSIMVSGYLLIGRSLRTRLSLLTYIWLVYSAAAGVLLLAVLFTGGPMLGFAAAAYAILLALAVGPQLGGHTAFNWALRYLSPAFIAIAILGEPVGAALLAFLILGERVAPLELAGFVLLLIGIYCAARAERRGTSTR